MKLTVLLLSVLEVLVLGQTCPEIPDNDVDFSAGFPPIPGDVPDGCSDFEILVARGTSEPNFADGGKFGVIVGDPVVSNVTARLPGARGYPVQYPAGIALTSSFVGTRDVVRRLSSQARLCPGQQFVLVGYSQGGLVMDRALDDVPAALADRIKAVVLFGYRAVGGRGVPAEFEDRTRWVCAKGDPVCDTGSCTFFHLTYIRPEFIDPAVEFIVERLSA